MPVIDTGFSPPLRLFGVPVRFHWTLPIGAVLMSGLSFAPGFWVGFVLVVLVHELGHAALVRSRGLTVVGIDITGFGGACKHTLGTERDSVVIAWGGVLAQLALGLLALALGTLVFSRLGAFGAQMYDALTRYSAFIALINLLPLPGLDGYLAWRVFKGVFRKRVAAGPTPAAKRRASDRDVVVRLDQYKAKRRADDDDAPPHDPSVQAEMERILRETLAEQRKGKPPKDHLN